MTDHAKEIAALERQIEYLSIQVERLIDLQQPEPSPMTVFRKTAMLQALSFEQEAMVRKLLGSVHAFRNSKRVDIREGLLPLPEETVEMFDEYATQGSIDGVQARNLLKTVIPGGDIAAQALIEAWEAVQQEFQGRN